MTRLAGCVVCLTPRPAELDWDWIEHHRIECPGARWGVWNEGDNT